MSQFDVHELLPRGGLVVDCQADLLAHLTTRFVVPLIRADEAPDTDKRLRPRFVIDGISLIMATPMASSVQKQRLGPIVAALTTESLAITGAIDVLISGI